MTDLNLSNTQQVWFDLANAGHEEYKEKLSCELANSPYEKEKNLNNLAELAEQGWEEAQRYLIQGCMYGYYGIVENMSWIPLFANAGWKHALEFVKASPTEFKEWKGQWMVAPNRQKYRVIK